MLKPKTALRRLKDYKSVRIYVGCRYVWLEGATVSGFRQVYIIYERPVPFAPVTTAERRKWADKILQELTK